MDILAEALKMLRAYPLCDRCLGRQFALLGHGVSNLERGKAIKTALALQAHADAQRGDVEARSILETLAVNGFSKVALRVLEKIGVSLEAPPNLKCHLCGGIFQKLGEFAEKATSLLSEYEYDTFLVGVSLPADVEEREDEFRAEFRVEYGESLRNELSREVGKLIQEATGKAVDFRNPDITVLVDPLRGDIRLDVKPLFIGGRYRKLVRGIPQCRWICVRCGGRGCPRCGWTGKMYAESVEELVAGPMVECAMGDGEAFHAAGREDVDALVLGPGRPFIVEIKNPRRRTLDLRVLEELVNRRAGGKVSIHNLYFADREAVRRLKSGERAEKIYEVVIEFDRNVTDEEVEELKNALTGAVIRQWTPRRVLHRRADKLRERRVYEVQVERLARNKVAMRVRCDGGLYIKELVTGDGGRTTPSVSEILGVEAKPIKLDVLDILMEGF